tara:strand:- start:1043 stop:2248 length:1206 start_codon:yes stop_codon:yes gene_type:complete
MNEEKYLPVKIVFFHIMRENFSGAQKNIFRLLINLDKNKIKPILVGQGKSPLTKLTEKNSIEVKIIPYPQELEVFDGNMLQFKPKLILNFLRGLLKYNRSFLSELDELKPDIIWCDNIRTFITLYFAAKKMNAKIIWNIWSEPEGKVAWILSRFGLVFADLINLEYGNQGNKIFGVLSKIRIFKKKLVPLYTGVSDFEIFLGTNIRQELSLPTNSLLIIMASSILPGKGQLDLIKSLQSLGEDFSNVHLILAGTPVESSVDSKEYYEKISGYVKDNYLSDKVHFIGWRDDIRDILSASNIYVSTSYSESFPDAVREAMLASLPIIVTDVGGTSELVDVNKNGYLFEPGDISKLTEYLKVLIEDKDLQKQMGQEGKRIIDIKFSTKVYAEDFEKMVNKLIFQ